MLRFYSTPPRSTRSMCLVTSGVRYASRRLSSLTTSLSVSALLCSSIAMTVYCDRENCHWWRQKWLPIDKEELFSSCNFRLDVDQRRELSCRDREIK